MGYKNKNLTVLIVVCLFVIITGFAVNNLLWASRSPVYFYRDSVMNIHWAVYYATWLRGKEFTYRPDVFELLDSRNIVCNFETYYREEYPVIFEGPLTDKKQIRFIDLLRFHHPPLWFMFTGGLLAVFGFKVWVIYLSQIMLGCITIWLTYSAAARLWSPTAGILSAFTLSTVPAFLFITKAGFIEAMVWPALLLGFIVIHLLLADPLKRRHYVYLGIVCGLNLLVKTSSFVFVMLFYLSLLVFLRAKKVLHRPVLRNLCISLGITLLFVMPYYIYASGSVSVYLNDLLVKGTDKVLFAPKNLVFLIFVVKDVLLGAVLFALFICALLYFFFRPKPQLWYLWVFLVFGYILFTYIPTRLGPRPYVVFLPMTMLFICCAVLAVPRFAKYLAVLLVVFSLVRGYAWLMPRFFPRDSMDYLYTIDAINENNYFLGIKRENAFSSLPPLPRMQQRAVYDLIKGIPTTVDLKLVALEETKEYTLERRTLSGSLALNALFEGFPLLIEERSKQDRYFEDRVRLFLRGPNEDAGAAVPDKRESRLMYRGSVSLTPAVRCDIFQETRNIPDQ